MTTAIETPSVPAAIVTANTDKKARRTRKKDIPSIVPAPVVPAPVVPVLTPEEERRQRIKALENSRKTARAVFAIEVMSLANQFDSAQIQASACIDKAIALFSLDMSADNKETIAAEMQKIYYKIDSWPVNKTGKKPVTVAAIMSPAGKWGKKEIERNGMTVPVYFIEDGTYYQFVPVALVRLVNAIQKRFYKTAPQTEEITEYRFTSEDYNNLWAMVSELTNKEEKERILNSLLLAEEKTVKKTVKK